MPRSHSAIHGGCRFKAPLCPLRVCLSPFVVRACYFISPRYSAAPLLRMFIPAHVAVCAVIGRSVRYLFVLNVSGPVTSLTDLQYVFHAAALQQTDAPSERQPRVVAALPATSDLLSTCVER